jgi:hypothetical protein
MLLYEDIEILKISGWMVIIISSIFQEGYLLYKKSLSFVACLALVTISIPIATFPTTEVQAESKIVKTMARTITQTQKQLQQGTLENIQLKSQALTVEKPNQAAQYISPIIKSDMVFTDVGVHWKKINQNPAISVRLSEDGKTWGKWIAVTPDEATVDHVKMTETFSELIYAGRAQYIQYRVKDVKEPVENLKLTLINSEDGKKIEKRSSFSLLGWFRGLVNKAGAAPDQPEVVTREEWGADESLRFKEDGTEEWPQKHAKKITHLVVHHTADELMPKTDNPDEKGDATEPIPNDPAARVRAIYYYHAVVKKWGDIGYNAIIGTDGKIYEGRKGTDKREEILSSKVVAGHAYSYNYGTFGVSLMGNYEENELPATMRKTLVKLLAYEAKIHGINPIGKKDYVRDYEGKDPNHPDVESGLNTILGHRDLPAASTLCPGKNVHRDLPFIRLDVFAKMK